MADHIDAGDLRFFAGVVGKGGRDEWLRRDRSALSHCLCRTIQAVRRSAPFVGLPFSSPMRNIFIESVMLFRSVANFAMHRVARRGGSEMGEAGAGQMDMGRIVRVDRGKQAAFRIGSCNVDPLAKPAFFHNLGYACFRIDRRMR